MNKEDKIIQILEEFKKTKLAAGKKRYDAMPTLFFFLGLGGGLLLNLSSSIIHETFKKYPGNIYEISVLILTLVFVIWFLWYLEKFYFTPLKKLEKKEAELTEKLEKELTK